MSSVEWSDIKVSSCHGKFYGKTVVTEERLVNKYQSYVKDGEIKVVIKTLEVFSVLVSLRTRSLA